MLAPSPKSSSRHSRFAAAAGPRALAVCAGVLAAIGACMAGSAARAQGGSGLGVAGAVPRKADPVLEKYADLFMHYSLMGDTQLAHDYGQTMLNKHPNPVDLLHAFEAARNGRSITRILLRDQRNAKLKTVANKLYTLLQNAHVAVIRNPARIKTEIKRMARGPRGYAIAKSRLRAAGQYAVPFFVQYLNNPADHRYQTYIIRMIQDIGRPVLNPLLEQLHTPNPAEKVQLINAIGEIGYPQALPYLKQISQNPKSSADLKRAAEVAFDRCNRRSQFGHYSAAHLFLNLAFGYFRHASSLTPANPHQPTNPVWYYDRGLNDVVGVPVPTPIWSDIETMRACERALEMKPDYPQAISLWIAADLRREIDLPAGQKDPTHKPGTPDANYYAVAAGPVYLNPALSLALGTHNSMLALRVIHALELTGGVHGMVGTGRTAGSPLLQALAYPDRAVRFAAAFALARANPRTKFEDSFRVVPVLGEALEQTGKPVALLVMKSDQQRNEMLAQMKKKFRVFAAPTFAAALAQAGHVAAINVAIVPGGAQTNALIVTSETDYRLQSTPVLVTGPAYEMSRLHLQYLSHPTFTVLPSTASMAMITAAYNKLQNTIGNSPVNNAKAMRWALASAQLLKQIARNRGSIYNANDALQPLVRTLKSKRQNLVVAAGAVLGYLNNPQAQIALAHAVLGKHYRPATERRGLFASLADSARTIGDHLSAGEVNKLVKVVSTDRNPRVRNAAARALGALNVPSNQASRLIRKQIRI